MEYLHSTLRDSIYNYGENVFFVLKMTMIFYIERIILFTITDSVSTSKKYKIYLFKDVRFS